MLTRVEAVQLRHPADIHPGLLQIDGGVGRRDRVAGVRQHHRKLHVWPFLSSTADDDPTTPPNWQRSGASPERETYQIRQSEVRCAGARGATA